MGGFENRPFRNNEAKMTETVHVPVLLRPVLDALSPKPGEIFLDGTLGGGGHTIEIARRVGSDGLVIGCDRDAAALDRTQQRIRMLAEPFSIRMAQANYADFPEVLQALAVPAVDGFLLDLGLSSDQLADRDRGFSFDSDGDLDLRFDATEGLAAFELLARLEESKIADLIYRYGEERFSRRIARRIVRLREEKRPVRTAHDLAEICRRVIPGHDRIDPATRTFQALRIAVNDELGSLERFLNAASNYLKPQGRIAIISFHSLEDRIVKNALRNDETLEIVTKKPIEADEAEVNENPRSRSAKLRVARKREQ